MNLLEMVDAANGTSSDEVDRTVSSNVLNVRNRYQESEHFPVYSRGYPARLTSEKTSGKNIRVNYVKDKNGKLVKASHTNIDDDQLNNTVQELIDYFNSKGNDNKK